MRRAIIPLLVALIAAGCGQEKVVDGVKYVTYGLANESEKKNPDICYEIIVGNVVWGVLLVETVVAPIYFFGFDLYEPIGKRSDVKGAACTQ